MILMIKDTEEAKVTTQPNKYDAYGLKRAFIESIVETTPKDSKKDISNIITDMIPVLRKRKEDIQTSGEAEQMYNDIDNEFSGLEDLISSIMDDWKARIHILQVNLSDLADTVGQWPDDMPKIAPTIWEKAPELQAYWENQLAPALNVLLPDPNALDQYSNNILKLFGVALNDLKKAHKEVLSNIASDTLDPFNNPHQVDVSYAASLRALTLKAVTRSVAQMTNIKRLAASAPVITTSPWEHQ